MAKTSGIQGRMADFYFEIEGPDGEVQVFGSADNNDDEVDEGESEK